MAPVSPAERMRRYRQRKNEEDSAGWSAKNAEKCKKYRQGLTGKKRKESNILAAKRKQRYRARRRADDGGQPVYKSRQALGKAVSRTTRALPHSPRKRQAVVANIALKVGLDLTIPPAKKQRPSTALTKEVKEAVVSYYKEDHISRALPGKKQTKSVRSTVTGKKEHVARRVLCYTLRELYQLFKEEPKHAGMQIGISKFAELRPTEVELVSYKSQNVCCCPYCENMNFLLKAAKWNDSIKSTYELVDHVVCSSDNSACMRRQCEKCILAKDCSDVIEALMDDERTDIPVRQWDGGHLKIEEFPHTSDLAAKIYKQLGPYVTHSCNIRLQSKAFSHQKECLLSLPKTIIIQLDFAENYGIKHQDEVMAAHWASTTPNEAVTIYTCVIHYVLDNEVKTQAVAVISNTQHHGTLESQVFNKEIFRYVKDGLRNDFDHIILWTDGAAAHFKNRYAMTALTFYKELYNSTVEWNFHESYHGKGPHDGIGAVLKSNVYKEVLRGRCTVNDATSFYEAAEKIVTKVKLLYVSTEQINSQKTTFNNIWQNVKGAKGIQKCRRIKVLDKYIIELYYDSKDNQPYARCNLLPTEAESDTSTSTASKLSYDTESECSFTVPALTPDSTFISEARAASPVHPQVGEYVIVKYTTKRSCKLYVAIVEEIDMSAETGRYRISCLRKSDGSYSFTFPTKADIDYVDDEDIEKLLPQPTISKRGVHSFHGVQFPSAIC